MARTWALPHSINEPIRIGVYTDLVFREDEGGYSTDKSFILFIAALASTLGEVVLFGRRHPTRGRAPYGLPNTHVRFVPFPYYPDATSIGGVLRSLSGSRRAFEAELDQLDAVWLFGPHPVAYELARVARRRGLAVFLGVRQDYPRYIGHRLPSRIWLWAVPVAHALEFAFRRLARTAPTVVVGDALASTYRGRGGRVLDTTVSLVRENDVADVKEAMSRCWDEKVRLLTVGRLDPEKNPLLLPEIVARLHEYHEGWQLTVVGSGSYDRRVAERASALGVADAIQLTGEVPFGDSLWELYTSSSAFLHVSLTEGVPQVLHEAAAAGLPIVATDVGGVRAALDNGRLGLVVPPRDAVAAVEALERLRTDYVLRRRLVEAGLAAARARTLDAEVDRVAEFFRSQLAAALTVTT